MYHGQNENNILYIENTIIFRLMCIERVNEGIKNQFICQNLFELFTNVNSIYMLRSLWI